MVKVKYISDKTSIIFKKGQAYEGYILDNYPNSGLLAFYFTEEEMDEAGYYALPAERFEIIGSVDHCGEEI